MRFNFKDSRKPVTKYPDIVMQTEDDVVTHLIDVKMDLGWKRDSIISFAKTWDDIIHNIQGTETTFKIGETKENILGIFAENLMYHIFVVTKKNANKDIIKYQKEINKLKNVKLYIFTEGIHPNTYNMKTDEVMHKIYINTFEFENFSSTFK